MDNAFFGTGYKEKEKPKDPLDGFDVAINVMGDIHKGKDKIEIIAGDIIIDGDKKGKMPCTSGTWVKFLKGEKIQNSTLTIVKSCGIMEGVDN